MDSLRPLLAQNRAAFTAVSSQYGMGVNDWDPGMACFSWGKCRDNIAEHFFGSHVPACVLRLLGRDCWHTVFALAGCQTCVSSPTRAGLGGKQAGMCKGVLRTLCRHSAEDGVAINVVAKGYFVVEEGGGRWKKVAESGRG